MMSRAGIKKSRPFSRFVANLLFVFELAILASLFAVMYPVLSAGYEKDYLSSLNLQLAELSQILHSRQSQIERELTELTLSNSIRVSLMLGMDTQTEEFMQQRYNKLSGVELYVRQVSKYFPHGVPDLNRYKAIFTALSYQSGITVLPLQRVLGGPPVILASAPIKRQATDLGTALAIYDPAMDEEFLNHFERKQFSQLIYGDEEGLFDVISGLPLDSDFNQGGAAMNVEQIIASYFPASRVMAWQQLPGFYLVYSMAPVNKQKGEFLSLFIYLSLAILLLTMLVVAIINRNVNQQIRRLADDAYSLAISESSDKLLVQNLHFDEFNTLAQAFNQLLEKRKDAEERVKHINEQLEKRVAKRTSQLALTNEQLKHEIEDRIRIEGDLKQAKELAEEASRLKSQFLANVSHEIRTPLHCIIGFCDILLQQHGDEDLKQQVAAILRESQMLLAIINDLLDHTKIEVGKMVLENAPFYLSNLLQSIISSAANLAEHKGLELFLDYPDALDAVFSGDRLRLHQVLNNLVNNAVKFTHTGLVRLMAEIDSASEEGLMVRFAVTDTGIGIPEDKQKTIFNSFTQADGSTTRKYGGTGLGTTIASDLVHLMGGSLVLSSKVDEGSEFSFTIYLPFAGEHAAAALSGEADIVDVSVLEVSRGDGYTLLLVEDYLTNRQVALHHLESVGYTVDAAEDGIEALEMCGQKKYDLILMDLQMPRMGGAEANRLLHEEACINNATPVIALTANAEQDIAETCRQEGFADVILKPVRRLPFLLKIQQTLERSGGAGGACIDYPLLLNEFDHDENLVRHILNEFIRESGESLERMSAALNKENLEAVRFEAHRLKGGSNNMTAAGLARAAEQTENAAKAGDLETACKFSSMCTEEYRRLVLYLEGE